MLECIKFFGHNQYGILASPQFPQYVAINPIIDSQCGQWRVDSHFEELPSSQVQVEQCLVISIPPSFAYSFHAHVPLP